MRYAITLRTVSISIPIAVVALATIYVLSSLIALGGLWIPAKGYGDGSGFWLLMAPANVASPEAGTIEHGSPVTAGGGSKGHLESTDGRVNNYSSICDNYFNQKDAMQAARRPSQNKIQRVYDTNGIQSGCGHIQLTFSATEHQGAETQNFDKRSGESHH